MIDAIDRSILAVLQQDGRRAFTAIAAELGISEATVRNRVARMRTLGVLRIVALCNPLSVGHESVRLLIGVRDRSPRAVGRSLANLPETNHVAVCTGAADLYIEATCADLEGIRRLLDEVRRTPGVATVELSILTRLVKDYSWRGLRGGVGQTSGSAVGSAPAARLEPDGGQRGRSASHG
jgi:Lrp/AsnC family transcriptional regulator for asnA, asnC and gidA